MAAFLFWFSLLIFLVWLILAFDFVAGVILKIPRLKSSSGLTGGSKISVIFAARNESASVHETISALLRQDYPNFEIIAVNDRSTDETLSILQSFSDPRLKVLNVTELPQGWLGKTHALYQGYLASSGEYLLFTDADVVFAPAALRAVMSSSGWDHLVLFPKLITQSLVEKIFTQTFGLALFRRFRPWDASNPKSTAHMGIGAFNMLTRGAYEKIGTHQNLALEVVDDVTLGRLVKEAGLRQRVMSGPDLISVRWVANAGGVIRSLEKNAFAGVEYKISTLLTATAAFLILDILPFFFLFFSQGPALYFNLGTVLCLISMLAVMGPKASGDWRLFWAHPFACLLLLFVMWRSAVLVLRAGGVRWRDTFYPLSQLRREKSR